jgi:hypothetical protein
MAKITKHAKSPPPPPLPPGSPRALTGAGDLFALIAEPVAKLLRLNTSKCGCAARRARWNRALPFSF